MRRPTSTLLRCLAAALALAISGVGAGAPPGLRDEPLPPPPPGVVHLEMGDLFVKPVGPRGLSLTERAKALQGKRVRVAGYMVRQEDPLPGVFLLTREPLAILDHEGGLSDLPTDHVRVLVPGADGAAAIPFTRRRLLLTGVLSLGNRAEGDGSVSVVRLTLDRADPRRQGAPKTNPKP